MTVISSREPTRIAGPNYYGVSSKGTYRQGAGGPPLALIARPLGRYPYEVLRTKMSTQSNMQMACLTDNAMAHQRRWNAASVTNFQLRLGPSHRLASWASASPATATDVLVRTPYVTAYVRLIPQLEASGPDTPRRSTASRQACRREIAWLVLRRTGLSHELLLLARPSRCQLNVQAVLRLYRWFDPAGLMRSGARCTVASRLSDDSLPWTRQANGHA